MELKEWRCLAVQSISLFLVVLLCCICFAEQLQKGTGNIVHAEVNSTNEGADKAEKGASEMEQMEEKTEKVKKRIVVIDAGHGGIDEGTISQNGKYLEKEYTLLIAKRLEKLLKEEGIIVYCTRTDDRYITKKERVKRAKKVKADLLISIHCNASDVGDTTSNGIETLYSKRKTNNVVLTNKKLATIMLDGLTKETNLRKRGSIMRNKLYVLRHADMPATIIEIGYMSNTKDLNFIRKESGQQKIAQGICNGVVRALEE